MSDYLAFIQSKAVRAALRGLERVPELSPHLFPFQRHVVDFSLRAGAAGCFLDTGLGKTEIQLEFCQKAIDSSKSRGGMPDYLLTFIKPGENTSPIVHTPKDFPLDQWQEWASPVWMTVQQSNVLNVRAAKNAQDERHLCPLQLDVIERALVMWSNAGDVTLSPFMGIGSEGVVSLKLGRRFIGVELKESYWKQACRYIDAQDRQDDLFAQEQHSPSTVLAAG